MDIVSSRKTRCYAAVERAWFATGITMIALAACVPLATPLASLFRTVSRSYNEGWNAFWADAAARSGSLYVSADSLVSNNYPPLSFHLVGLIGRFTGDNVIAGRLVSLASFVVMIFAAYLLLRAAGVARQTALAGAAILLATFAYYGDNYVAMNDPQMLAHALMLTAVVVLWRFDFSTTAIVAGAALMLLGGFTKHLLIPLPVAVTLWLAIYRRKSLPLWLACFAVGVPLGFWLTSSSYPLFVDDLLSARMYLLDQGVSATTHTLFRFLPLLILGAVPIVRAMRAGGASALTPRTTFALLYVVLSLVIGAIAAGGAGVTRNAFFDLLIASSLFAALGLAWLQENRRAPRIVPLSAASASIMVLGAGILVYAAMLVPQTVREVRHLDSLEADTRATIAMIQRLGQGHAACETIALCYWARGPFTIDFFNYGQKMLTGALSVEACKASFERGDFPVLQLELDRKIVGSRLWPCTPAIRQYYTEAFRSQAGMLLVPRHALTHVLARS